jgi:hypothetical protein
MKSRATKHGIITTIWRNDDGVIKPVPAFIPKSYTNFENRVLEAMDGFLQGSCNDVYAICKNIIKYHGEEATDEQIAEEVELFYTA